MKKIVSVALVLGSLSIGSTSFARGGNDPARGTQGWFVEESVEHVIRKLAATKIQSNYWTIQ